MAEWFKHGKRDQYGTSTTETTETNNLPIDKIASAELCRRDLLRALSAASAGLLLPTLPGTIGANTSIRLLNYQFSHHDTTRLLLDLSAEPADLDLFMLENPLRLVIDLAGVNAAGLKDSQYTQGLVSAVRFGNHQNKTRIVVDLRAPASPNYRLLDRQNGVRLHVDMGAAIQQAGVPKSQPRRDVVIAIDAGHGGKDPGAVGQKKTREKDVTLQIAKRLSGELLKQRGIRVVMIRDSDTYLGLKDRTTIARERGADLFVSLHADAFPRREAKGSSVYALSLKGASSEAAKFLAEQENSYDPLEGVDLGDMSADLKRALIELSQSSTIESSLELGDRILRRLGKVGNVHKDHVEQANFAVLRSPEIPSVLVETAFISNLQEERKLRSKGFQKKLAAAIRGGLIEYLQVRAPQNTWFSEHRG